MPFYEEVSNGEISDSAYRDFLNTAGRLGFSQRLEPRGVNTHQLGTPTREQVGDLLAVSPDFAEFIVPVFWSRREFVGALAGDDSHDLALIKQGYEIISTAGAAEAARMPALPKKPDPSESRFRIKSKSESVTFPTEPWDLDYMAWAYVDGTIRGTALQTFPDPTVRRQGWLMIGRKGIVLMGFRTSLTPAMSFQMANPNSVLRSPRQAHFSVATHVPNDVDGCQLFVEEFLPYTEIESVAQVELVRFDGLAALLYALHYAACRGVMATPTLTRGSDIVNFSAFIDGLVGVFKPMFGDEYICAAFDRIHYGANVANGTGVTSKGSPNLTLFNSALGLAVQSAKNGRQFFVESPFQELDAALSLIESEIETAVEAPKVASSAPASPPSSLASELERLAALKQAGLLSDAEYSAAKNRLLS